MTIASNFNRTITGTTDLTLNDLQVNGQATINDLNANDIQLDSGEIGDLVLTNVSGNTFTVNSITPATSVLTASSVIRGGLGVVSNIIVGDTVTIQSSTASVSQTTGALIVTGGAGFGGRVSANSCFVKNAAITSNGDELFLNAVFSTVALRPNFSVNGQLINTPSVLELSDLTTNVILSVDKTTQITTLKKLAVSDTTVSTSKTTGCAVFTGGLGVGDRLNAGSFGLGNTTVTTVANDFIVQANSDSIYLKPSGAATNSELINGVSVFTIKNSSGTIVHSLDKTTNKTSLNSLAVTSTTNATSTTTGCATFTGGVGIAGDLRTNFIAVKNVGFSSNNDDIFIAANNNLIALRPQPGSNGQFAVDTNSMSFTDAAGVVILATVKSTQTTSIVKLAQVTNTTASTSSTTGAATFVGGIGISNTTQATSATNGGSLTTAGGIGVAKDAYIGGAATVTGALTCSQITFTGNSGTFTPVILSDTTVTYTTQTGYWRLIGKMAFINLTVVTTSALYIGSGVNLSVAGLPFNAGIAVGEEQYFNGPLLINYALPTSTDYIVSQLTYGNNNVKFYAVRDGLSETFVVAPTSAATRTIKLSLFYQIV